MICPSVRLWLLWLRENRQGQTTALESTYWLLSQWTPQLDSEDRPALVAKGGLVWPHSRLRGPHGAGSSHLVCQSYSLLLCRLMRLRALGRAVPLCPLGPIQSQSTSLVCLCPNVLFQACYCDWVTSVLLILSTVCQGCSFFLLSRIR